MKRVKRTHDLAVLTVDSCDRISFPRCPSSPVSVVSPAAASLPNLKHSESFKRKRSESVASLGMAELSAGLDWVCSDRDSEDSATCITEEAHPLVI